MKRTLSLIALVAICSAMMVSCKNVKSNEPTPEEIEAQKLALADSVLAIVDNLSAQYQEISNEANFLEIIKLTDEQKMVKPDYLLDLSLAETFLTREQKTNALAIYATDILVRQLFDMPTDEANAVISKLLADLNRPLDISILSSGEKASEMLVEQYNKTKEMGEVNYFWKFQFAVLLEVEYFLSKDPDLYLANYTEEMNQASLNQWKYICTALIELAPYDEEIKLLLEDWSALYNNMTPEEVNACFETVEKAKETYKSGKFNVEEVRNALLQ